jgi:hypothetical protein
VGQADQGRLIVLPQHPILGPEVASSVAHELRVAKVIDRLHADDELHQVGIMLTDVFDQLGLGIGRPSNQNRAGVGDRASDGLKEVVVFGGVPAPDGVRLVVYMELALWCIWRVG